MEGVPRLLAFATAAGLLAPLTGATVGAGLVALAFGASYLAVWPTWFLADSIGNLILGPLVVLLIQAWRRRREVRADHLRRLLPLAVLVTGACAAVFLRRSYPLAFLLVPVAVMATHLAGPLGATLSAVIVALTGGAATLRACARDGDRSARFGGEEFVVLLPHTTLTEAHRIGERLRRAVEGNAPPGRPLPQVTVGAGAAEAAWGEDAESLLMRADRALYAAEGAGRSRVELAA